MPSKPRSPAEAKRSSSPHVTARARSGIRCPTKPQAKRGDEERTTAARRHFASDWAATTSPPLSRRAATAAASVCRGGSALRFGLREMLLVTIISS
ncbi:unnamed protein product [Urochloa humidicola]